MKYILITFATLLLATVLILLIRSGNDQPPLPADIAVVQPTVAPQVTPISTTPPVKIPTTTPPVTTLLNTVDLSVPFMAQAPTGNWDAFHEEACEEASSSMVWHYFQKQPIASTNQFEQDMSDAATWERANVGTDVSTPATDIVKMLREHFGLDAHTAAPGTALFRQELSAGHLIILPSQGQLLHNPFYTPPGPIYHMLVLRGYDGAGNFITNDSGTKHGEGYIYDPTVLLNANHDWNNGDVINGQKIAIVVTGLL